MAADPAGDRRHDARELEIQVGVAHLRFGGVERGVGVAQLLQPLVVGADRHEILGAQLGGALELAVGELDGGVGLVDLGLRGGALDLERPRVDDEQEVALLDQLAVLEMDLLEIAADPGAQLDIVDRGELPGELVALDDLLAQRLADRDRRRRRRGGRRRLALGAFQHVPGPAHDGDGDHDP